MTETPFDWTNAIIISAIGGFILALIVMAFYMVFIFKGA